MINTSALITKSRILFRPGETLKAMQKTLRYERVEQLPKGKKGAQSTSPEDPGHTAAETTGQETV